MTFLRFGLIVTGKGEKAFLPKFFRSLQARASCTFEVIRKSEQLTPITSQRRLQKLQIRGKTIPTTDQEQYGLAAAGYLKKHSNSFVIVIDDMEKDRREIASEVYRRYRKALDSVLQQQGLSSRASVHFLVNMLEAYYFADSNAVNEAASRIILVADHDTDVEDIPHPKNHLQSHCWKEFDEIKNGQSILDKIDLNRVLSNQLHCCWLRNLVAWCVQQLETHHAIFDLDLAELYKLPRGNRAVVTGNQ